MSAGVAEPGGPAGPGARFVFLFGVVYLGLHHLTAFVALVPGLGGPAKELAFAILRGCAWVGKQVLGLARDIPVGPTGSSDTTADWIRVGLYLTLAAGVAAWGASGGRGFRDEARVRARLGLGLRYVLGSAMVVYGCMKMLPPIQFPAPSLAQLSQPLGEASPQGLLWRFMGFSPVYAAGLGAGEVIAGVLLLYRRTALAGALLTAGIMAHVVLLNFTYDVPVKVYSGHLLLTALWLLWPERGRLTALLLGRGAVARVAEPGPALAPALRRWSAVGQAVVIAGIGWQAIGGQFANQRDEAASYGATPAELRGIWRVEEFGRAGTIVPPLATDHTRWHTVIFGDYRTVLVRRIDGGRAGFWFVRKDPATGSYALEKPGAGGGPAPMTVIWQESDRLNLQVQLDGQALEVALRRTDERAYPLLKRGFRWIIEKSDNR